MRAKDRINIILFGKAAEDGKVFYDALANLELPHSIINFTGINQISTYLDTVNPLLHNVLIFYVSKFHNAYLSHIETVRQIPRYQNFSILLYDPVGAINEEEAFAAGANIYLHKPSDSKQFKIKLRHLFGVNCQYLGGNLNHETFFLSI